MSSHPNQYVAVFCIGPIQVKRKCLFWPVPHHHVSAHHLKMFKHPCCKTPSKLRIILISLRSETLARLSSPVEDPEVLVQVMLLDVVLCIQD